MEAEKNKKVAKPQLKLDGKFEKLRSPREFTCDGILHAVAQYVVCNDQVHFRDLSIHPKRYQTTYHNITRHIHNKFVQWLQELKDNITVSITMRDSSASKNLMNFRLDLEKSCVLQMVGLLIPQRPHSLE
jgi:hypothetical protein